MQHSYLANDEVFVLFNSWMRHSKLRLQKCEGRKALLGSQDPFIILKEWLNLTVETGMPTVPRTLASMYTVYSG